MGYRMSDANWTEVMAVDVIDDRLARMLAEEFTGGWATCWFADTGEFAHDLMRPHNGSYAQSMIRALFDWWMEREDGTERTDYRRAVKARALMLDYLTRREADNAVGPIEGFATLWPTGPARNLK